MRHIKTITRRLPLLLFTLIILFSGFTAYHYANHILDSDAASELVLGKLLADENKIVTSDWLYGSELRLFNSNLIYMPLFKIFDNWRTIRFISILIFQALMALSYYYLSRRMKISLNAYFLSATLFLLPSSVVYGRMMLYHNHYAFTSIYGFLIAGLYLAFLENRKRNRLLQMLRLFAMLLLSLMSCINGFRQLPGTMIPLLMTALIVSLKEHRSAPNTLCSLSRQSWLRIGLAGIVFITGVAGLMINTYVFPQYFSFTLRDTSVLGLPSVENLRKLLIGYLSLFGFQEGRTLFSTEGILALSGVFAAFVLLAVSLQDIIPRQKPVNPHGAFLGVFYPVAMLCMTFTFLIVFGNDNYPQYYLPAFVWIFPYLGLQADRMPVLIKQLSLKQLLVLLACICLFINGVYYNLYYLNPDDKQVEYDTRIEIGQSEHFDGVIAFIKENEFDVGYATFWKAYTLTEVTSGEIPMIPLVRKYLPNSYAYHDILFNKKWFDYPYVEDKNVFLLLDYYESFIFCETELAQYSIPVYEDDYYRIYAFDFASDVWDFLLEQAVVYNQQPVLEHLLPQGEQRTQFSSKTSPYAAHLVRGQQSS